MAEVVGKPWRFRWTRSSKQTSNRHYSSHTVSNVPFSWMSIVSSGPGPRLVNLCRVSGRHDEDLAKFGNDLPAADFKLRPTLSDDEGFRVRMLVSLWPRRLLQDS